MDRDKVRTAMKMIKVNLDLAKIHMGGNNDESLFIDFREIIMWAQRGLQEVKDHG